MSTEELQKSLERLRAEIDIAEKNNKPVRERLDGLVADIEHQVHDSDDHDHRQGLLERIPGEIEEIELSHPRITNILNHVMVTLSNMGI